VFDFVCDVDAQRLTWASRQTDPGPTSSILVLTPDGEIATLHHMDGAIWDIDADADRVYWSENAAMMALSFE
jgi:hypothetical protein